MDVLSFILLGLGVGGGYALAAQGMVLVYRGSGVINLATGAIAGVGAFGYYELTSRGLMAPLPAVAVATLACGLLGLVIHLAVMRPLQQASGLVRLVATIGIMTVLSQILLLRYGANLDLMQPLFSASPVHLDGSSLVIPENRIWLFGVAAVLSVILAVVYRYTRVGVATTALAEQEQVVAAHGWHPGRLAALNWVVGCALGGLAGALLGPVIFLTPTSATLLVMPLLAAALLGGFRSFPLAFAGALAVGVGQSLLTEYISQPGWADALPFLIVVVILVVRGTSLPVRSHVLERLSRVGDPRARLSTLLALGIAAVLAVQLLNGQWAISASTTFAFATVGLSVVLITGYGGQLSLAQMAMAGIGAVVAARVVAVAGVSFWVGLLCAIAVSIPVGLIVGLPALRTRGVNLAIATLGLAIAVEDIVLGNGSLTGGLGGTNVRAPSLFGLSLSPIAEPQRYAGLCVAGFVVCGLLVRNIRRGPGGRRLLAVRSNERAAASMGINVMTTKLYGFVLGACIAAVGGTLIAFQNTSVTFGDFTALASIELVVFVVIGGTGFASSALQGALMGVGGLVAVALNQLIPLGRYVLLIGGVSVILVLVQNPDGVIPPTLALFRKLRLLRTEPAGHVFVASSRPLRVRPERLEVRDLSVLLGGIQALDGVSFEIEPGEIVGLIGPNGAGKTTCIDVISGFTRSRGRVNLGDRDVTGMSPSRRAAHGMGRSFQSLELLEDQSVWENLATASEISRSRSWGVDLLRPRPAVLSDAAIAAVETFGLAAHLDRLPSELPAGTRRSVAIARAVAVAPSVLLLDEPAAGLDDTETAELGTLLARVASQWGMGVLLVEHDMSLVMSVCDRIVVLDRGRRIADGPPSAIACAKVVIDAYLGIPVPAGSKQMQPEAGDQVGTVA